MTSSLRLSLLLSIVCIAAATAAAQSANWSYTGKTGPMAWSRLDPAYAACASGHEQSPIDIRKAHLDTSLAPIEFHYIAGPVVLENNGRTIVAHVDPGSYIVIGGVRYNLVEYQFRHPSEEPVKAKLTDMSVQLLHKSADGKMVVLAVRLVENQDAPNAVLAALVDRLPRAAGQTAKVDDMVNTGGLLPSDRGYWTYMGSLTTPPCTEGVRWFVFEQPVTLSRTQLRLFTSILGVNSRPMQDAHGRTIEANE
jgi:carbonic anhydrase